MSVGVHQNPQCVVGCRLASISNQRLELKCSGRLVRALLKRGFCVRQKRSQLLCIRSRILPIPASQGWINSRSPSMTDGADERPAKSMFHSKRLFEMRFVLPRRCAGSRRGWRGVLPLVPRVSRTLGRQTDATDRHVLSRFREDGSVSRLGIEIEGVPWPAGAGNANVEIESQPQPNQSMNGSPRLTSPTRAKFFTAESLRWMRALLPADE
jgi:hypothetical protein